MVESHRGHDDPDLQPHHHHHHALTLGLAGNQPDPHTWTSPHPRTMGLEGEHADTDARACADAWAMGVAGRERDAEPHPRPHARTMAMARRHDGQAVHGGFDPSTPGMDRRACPGHPTAYTCPRAPGAFGTTGGGCMGDRTPVTPTQPHWPQAARQWARVLEGLRSEVEVWLVCTPTSMKRLARQMGVNRRTLTLWLAGDDRVSVRTLTRVATWLQVTSLVPGIKTRTAHDTLDNGKA